MTYQRRNRIFSFCVRRPLKMHNSARNHNWRATSPKPMRVRARGSCCWAAGTPALKDGRCQADALQSGQDRGEIIGRVGRDSLKRAQPGDGAAFHFDEKPQRLVRTHEIGPRGVPPGRRQQFGGPWKRARCCDTTPNVGHRQGTVGESSLSKPTHCRPVHFLARGPAEALGRAASPHTEWPLAPLTKFRGPIRHNRSLSARHIVHIGVILRQSANSTQ